MFSLGFHYRFDIIYDDGDQELQIGEYFLERMRIWRVKGGKFSNIFIFYFYIQIIFYTAYISKHWPSKMAFVYLDEQNYTLLL